MTNNQLYLASEKMTPSECNEFDTGKKLKLKHISEAALFRTF